MIKVDRPLRSGFSQPGSPYGNPCNGLSSFTNRVPGSNPYQTHSVVGSVGRPVAYHNVMDNSPSFSSASSFEYVPPAPMTANSMSAAMAGASMANAMGGNPMATAMHAPQQTMMMMPTAHQVQPVGVMQQQLGQQPVQQQMMYRPVQMQQSIPQLAPQSVPPFPPQYVPQNLMYPTHQGMSFGYRPMMQHGRMIPSGMPMMAAGNTLGPQAANPFSNQQPMFNPLAQQLVY